MCLCVHRRGAWLGWEPRECASDVVRGVSAAIIPNLTCCREPARLASYVCLLLRAAIDFNSTILVLLCVRPPDTPAAPARPSFPGRIRTDSQRTTPPVASLRRSFSDLSPASYRSTARRPT